MVDTFSFVYLTLEKHLGYCSDHKKFEYHMDFFQYLVQFSGSCPSGRLHVRHQSYLLFSEYNSASSRASGLCLSASGLSPSRVLTVSQRACFGSLCLFAGGALIPPLFLKIRLILVVIVPAPVGALSSSRGATPACVVVVITASAFRVLLGALVLCRGYCILMVNLVLHVLLGVLRIPLLFLGWRCAQGGAGLFALLWRWISLLQEIALFVAHGNQVGHTGLISPKVFPFL